MSVEQSILSALSTIDALKLSGGSAAVYQDDFPQPEGDPPTWPAVRFVLIGGAIEDDLCGDGDGDGDDVLVQIDVVSKTTEQRRAIWDAVRVAMKTVDPPARLQAPPTMSRDAETKTYRASGDWMIYGSTD